MVSPRASKDRCSVMTTGPPITMLSFSFTSNQCDGICYPGLVLCYVEQEAGIPCAIETALLTLPRSSPILLTDSKEESQGEANTGNKYILGIQGICYNKSRKSHGWKIYCSIYIP